ncbi:hypothetical protein [Demequina sp. NBRC 110055]|uniref:hypothetical protein n=1 Tax=Demequina sp. NBRC 110055 TaxID=1570344 RepID=UPI000A01DA6C|nr:hypothetical protein [Demequina sp. NBRC 110055]
MGGFDRVRVRSATSPEAYHPAPDAQPSGAPEWMATLPPPPLGPSTNPTPVVVRGRWLRSVMSAVGFGVMGAVLYASLYILVGAEVQAAAVVIGVMVGSGLRLGGRQPGAATGTVAVAIALLSLAVGVAVGQASLDSIALPAPLTGTLGDVFRSPGPALARYFSAPVIASLAVGLTAAGALLATLTFRPRRSSGQFDHSS